MNISTQYESMSKEALLDLFVENRDENLKRELVLRYSYLVKTIAMQMRSAYISIADMDDLINEGIIALMDALNRFDPDKNVKFVSYASLRIRGAIIDFARRQDWTPRSVRKTAREIDSASGELQIRLGRSATEQEMADYLGMDLAKYRKALTDSNLYNLLSLDAIIDETQSEWFFQSATGSTTQNDPSLRLQSAELSKALESSILKLKPREQTILSLYYRKELTMKEIAKVLGISEPRVSQIQSGALSQLRRGLEEYMT